MIEQIDHISDIYVLTWWVFAKYGWSHMIAAGIKTVCLYAKHMNVAINYHRRVKIRWAKYSWFQPYEVFRGNTFVVHWPLVFIVYL